MTNRWTHYCAGGPELDFRIVDPSQPKVTTLAALVFLPFGDVLVVLGRSGPVSPRQRRSDVEVCLRPREPDAAIPLHQLQRFQSDQQPPHVTGVQRQRERQLTATRRAVLQRLEDPASTLAGCLRPPCIVSEFGLSARLLTRGVT